MSSSGQEEQIWTVLADCVMHWRIRNRLPRERVSERVMEMREELERHFQEAAEEGKPVEEIVGPDVHTFAEEWGASEGRHLSRREVALELTTFHFAGLTGLLFAAHLWKRSLNFTFNPRKYAGLIALMWAVSAVRDVRQRAEEIYGGQGKQDRWPLWKRLGAGAAYDAGSLVSILGVNLAVQDGRRSAFSEWSWRATATILTVSLAALIRRGRDQITPEELGLSPEDVEGDGDLS